MIEVDKLSDGAAGVLERTAEESPSIPVSVTTTVPAAPQVGANQRRKRVTINASKATSGIYFKIGPTRIDTSTSDYVSLGGTATVAARGAVWLVAESGTQDVRVVEEVF